MDHALSRSATALLSSQSANGACYSRIRARMDRPRTLSAPKLARQIYTTITKGEEYTKRGLDRFE